MLSVVTVTGADDSVDPDDLVSISRELPFVEFGVLVGSHQGVPRFPSLAWLARLEEVASELYLSLHLCGREVVEFFERDKLQEGWHGRCQINTHGEFLKVSTMQVRRNVGIANWRCQQVIFQLDGANDGLLRACRGRRLGDHLDNLNVAGLFDLSHRAGVLPEAWPRPIPGVYCGYAGGLGPDNVARELEKISAAAGEAPFWIDAATKLRTDERFDLDKVRRFLEAARPFVVPIP
jgi:hypothetical protein